MSSISPTKGFEPASPHADPEMSMADRVTSYDWSVTPLGPRDTWPKALEIAIQIIMSSRFPMFIWWGPELINIYNDAYVPILGKKHPASFARPAAEVWYEIWDVIGPQAEIATKQRQSTWNEEMLLVLERYGYSEETYFTWSYSPIGAGGGPAQGLFCAVTEDTSKVIRRRRLRTLRELASETADLRSTSDAVAAALNVIRRNRYDIPFALVYLGDEDGNAATLAGAAGLDEASLGPPTRVGFDANANPWDVNLQSHEIRVVNDLSRFLGEVPTGPWPVPPREALLIPFAKVAEGPSVGFMIAGVSVYAMLDDEYRGFLTLVAGHIAAAIANSRAYEQERRRAEALAELDRAKTAFFSNVSHEFRTPLTLLLGPLEDTLANRDGSLSTGAAASLEISHRNALRLLKLVNTMLDFSRIEAGRARASYQPVDLASLTADLASNFRSLSEKAGLRLIVHCPPLSSGEPAYVDRDMWEKIVLNLVSNAFKFTLQGEIEVRLEAQGRQAVLTVRDTGVGIPSEELPRIFERFHRIEQSRGRTHEGTGIGLALVHELVKLHSGTVRVESLRGAGSTFTVAIPLGKTHLDPERVVQGETAPPSPLIHSAFVEEALRWLPDEPSREGQAGKTGSEIAFETNGIFEAEPAIKKPRILWADDNADMRSYVRRLLGDRFDVTAVADGKAALDLARAHDYDLVLADVMMPGLDGFGLVRELRADPRLRDIPVILLSARAGEEARIEGIHAGADDYLVKPFSALELLALLESHVKMSRLRHETLGIIQEAERNARLLASIVDSSDDAIISKDLNGIITSWNKGAERLFGYTAAETVGQPILILIPSDRLDEEPEILARLRRGERVDHFETIRRRKDGRLLDISLTISPVKDSAGLIVGASKIARDISDRKRAEEALRRANQDLEQFALSATHDLREPIRTIKVYCELLAARHEQGLDPEALKFLKYVSTSAGRMDTLVSDLLTYTRIANADAPKEASDASAALADALANLRGAIAESGAVVTSDPLPVLQIPGAHLTQLLQNLIGNAIKYRNPERPPVIHIGCQKQGNVWKLSIRDNGIGIEAPHRERIFGLFERLNGRDASSGTGIGLALCQRIVQRCQGRIWVESEPGKGSTFFFTIPE